MGEIEMQPITDRGVLKEAEEQDLTTHTDL